MEIPKHCSFCGSKLNPNCGQYCSDCGKQQIVTPTKPTVSKSSPDDDVIITDVKRVRCTICHEIKRGHRCTGTPCLSSDICGQPERHKYPHQAKEALENNKKRKADVDPVKEVKEEALAREWQIEKSEEFIKKVTVLAEDFDEYYKSDLGKQKAAKLISSLVSQLIATLSANKRRKLNNDEVIIPTAAPVVEEFQMNNTNVQQNNNNDN